MIMDIINIIVNLDIYNKYVGPYLAICFYILVIINIILILLNKSSKTKTIIDKTIIFIIITHIILDISFNILWLISCIVK